MGRRVLSTAPTNTWRATLLRAARRSAQSLRRCSRSTVSHSTLSERKASPSTRLRLPLTVRCGHTRASSHQMSWRVCPVVGLTMAALAACSMAAPNSLAALRISTKDGRSWLVQRCYGSDGTVSDGADVVVAIFAPVSVALPGGHRLNVSTEYPFDDAVHVTLEAGTSTATVPGLWLRISSWSNRTSISSIGREGQSEQFWPSTTSSGALFRIPTSSRRVHSVDVSVRFDFASSLRVVHRTNNAIAVYLGPLLFGLNVCPTLRQTHSYANTSACMKRPCGLRDLLVNRTAPWNYAIEYNGVPAESFKVVRVQRPEGAALIGPGTPPFSLEGATSGVWSLRAWARLVHGWALEPRRRGRDAATLTVAPSQHGRWTDAGEGVCGGGAAAFWARCAARQRVAVLHAWLNGLFC
eukprot:SAG11_NODE_1522_length_4752_cov_6.171287_1_plen_410_part_00